MGVLLGSSRSDSRIASRRVGVVVVMVSALVVGSCSWGGESDENRDDTPVSESLGTDHLCEFVDVGEVERVFFGDIIEDDLKEMSGDDFLGCDQYLSIEQGDDETGSLDFTFRVFSDTDSKARPTGDWMTEKDDIGWFSTEAQSDANEVIDSSIEPVSDEWDDGEVYVLDGLYRNRDLYIVGGWGRIGDLQFGVAFKLTAEQEYFDQPLVYHEYCDATDLESDCLISSDVLYEWMSSEYLPAVLDRLEAAEEG